MKKEIIRQTDYAQSERPKTRSKQFFDIFKHRFVELIKLSLLQTVFNMPLLVSVFLFWMTLNNIKNGNELFTAFLIQACSLLISLPSCFTGLTGSFYAIKKLVYAEGEYASSSFFIGLREEWKKGLLVGLIAGLSAGIAVIGCYFFIFYGEGLNTAMIGFGIAIVIIQLMVVLMVCYHSISQIVVYNNTFKNILKNSFIITLMRFPMNLGILLIHPGIFVALICIMNITMYVGLGLLILTCAIGHLLWMLNCVSAFDKFINKEQFPDYYRKGLYKEESKEN